jgi:hypothetical protein
MVWIYYKFARVEQNCGRNKQRQLKQLPDEMWKRKPMSGAAETYPVSDNPKHKVYGAIDSQDVQIELSGEWHRRKPNPSPGKTVKTD